MQYVYTVLHELTSPKFAKAFAKGCNGAVKSYEDYELGSWAGFGSPESWGGLQQTIKAGYDWYYGDHAYFGRHKYYKVAKNAYQHSGVGEPDIARLREFYREALPWKRGGHIVVCPQSDSHLERFGAPNWLEETKAIISANSDRPMIVRYKRDERPLEKDLRNAWALVTHSSASAIHALMHGVPVFCTATCAASVMGLSDLAKIESPYYPDGRMEWAGVLAANQWTLDEIARGKCWSQLNETL